MSSVTQAYGPNIAFIEELYEKYRTNPDAVSASWREFFADYQPVFEEEHDALEQPQVAAAGGVATVVPQVPAPAVAAPAPAPRRRDRPVEWRRGLCTTKKHHYLNVLR